MGTLKKVQTRLDAIDAIIWTLEVKPPHTSQLERLFFTKWVGYVAFYRQPMAEGTRGGVKERLAVPASWDDEGIYQGHFSSSPTIVNLRTDLPGDALTRVDRFRNGGRLFARAEGQFRMVWLGGVNDTPAMVAEGIARSHLPLHRYMWHDECGETIELSRDFWASELLPQLRPPGRVAFEATLPKIASEEEAGKRALQYLTDAQRDFDEGRYPQTAALVYKAVEALQTLLGSVERAYGLMVRKFIASQCGALSALANDVRHDDAKLQRTASTIDRTLALHLLTSCQCLASVVMVPA